MWEQASERFARLLLPETLRNLGILVAISIALAVVVRVKWTYGFDLRVTRYLQKLDTPGLTKAARFFTWMGNSSTVIALSLIIAGFLAYRGEGTAAVLLAATNLSLVVSTIVKHLVDRARPGEKEAVIHGGPRWSYSYPSGHSMGAAACYGFLSVLLELALKPGPEKDFVTAVLVTLPIFIGLSRVYLGAHWFSDVVGGWTGGVLFVLMLTAMLGPAVRNEEPGQTRTASPSPTNTVSASSEKGRT